METPVIRFVKTHPDAQLPKFNIKHPETGDIGADLTAVSNFFIPAKSSTVVPVGLKVGYIQPGYYFNIAGRSGLGFKHGLMPHAGRIDNQYRGDLGVKLYNLSDKDYAGSTGDKIAQIEFHKLIQPQLEWIDESAVEATTRGENAFGSSGK